jgi:flotillin
MQGGKPATAGFLSGMLGAVPPLQELFKMAGMELPSYLGVDKNEAAPATQEPSNE